MKTINWTSALDMKCVELKKFCSAAKIAEILFGDVGLRNAVIGRMHRKNLMPVRVKKMPEQKPVITQKIPAILFTVKKHKTEHTVNACGVRPIDIEAHSCRWPIGDPKSPTFRFCGVEKELGSYCVNHHRIAYTAAKPRQRVDKSIPEIVQVSA